ncbi:MAG: hypothetical protein ACRES5_21145 [Pseudomonas sp.]|uniref:hypothetical protein n=1 Tax=Stenotrophomonas sp. TaxID=69392 RepID=UPI003D6C757A
MTTYRVIAEGLFVNAPGIDGYCGFYTTLFISADSFDSMLHRAELMLRNRQDAFNITPVNGSIIKSHYLAFSCAEVTDSSFEFDDQTGSGFSFFTITGWDRIHLPTRHLFLRAFKPWKLLAGQPSEVKRLKGISAQ